MKQDRYLTTKREYLDDRTFYSIFGKIEIKKQLKLNSLHSELELERSITPLKLVDGQTAQEFYQDHPDLFTQSPPKIHVREIVVKDQTMAFNLLKRIRLGGSFVDLARQYSTDPPQYRDQGGDLGWVHLKQMPAPWESVAFSLKPNEVSDIFSFKNYYYILQILQGPIYDVVPYYEIHAQVALVASEYRQHQQFTTWLSTQILHESLVILRNEYTTPVQNAIKDLRNNLGQEQTLGL